MSTTPIHENPTYSVDKATIKLKTGTYPEGTPCYSITNKDTEMLEAETTCLADAIFTADKFHSSLVDMGFKEDPDADVPEIQYNDSNIITIN